MSRQGSTAEVVEQDLQSFLSSRRLWRRRARETAIASRPLATPTSAGRRRLKRMPQAVVATVAVVQAASLGAILVAKRLLKATQSQTNNRKIDSDQAP